MVVVHERAGASNSGLILLRSSIDHSRLDRICCAQRSQTAHPNGLRRHGNGQRGDATDDILPDFFTAGSVYGQDSTTRSHDCHFTLSVLLTLNKMLCLV